MDAKIKCTVTGGAGFIGSNLIESLLEKNYSVICLDNLLTGNLGNIRKFRKSANFEFIQHDLSKKPDKKISDTMAGTRYLYHLASPASPPKYQKYSLETMMVNSVGTRYMLDLALENKSIFLLASTSEIYGNPEIHPQKESYFGNVNTLGIRACYDESKRFAETITMEYFRKFQVKTRIVRIFNTYGPNMEPDDGRVVSNFINQRLNKKKLTVYGSGDQTRSFCFVQDMVAGLISAMETDNIDGEVFNLGNPDERTVMEIGRIIMRLIDNGPQDFRFLPLPQDDPEKRKPDISKAIKYLKWKPEISLEKGLIKTIRYFRSL